METIIQMWWLWLIIATVIPVFLFFIEIFLFKKLMTNTLLDNMPRVFYTAMFTSVLGVVVFTVNLFFLVISVSVQVVRYSLLNQG